MGEKIAIDVEVNGGNSSQTLGDLKKDFQRLNEQIENVDVNSKEFKKLQAQIVKTGGKVKNLELSMESLNSEGVASAIGGLAGGIGGVTSALVLMGGENETVKEMTNNIQNAMAISMGLKGAVEGMSFGYKLFNNVLKTNAVVMRLSAIATNFFSKALIATGIGAIVIGLGLLIANFKLVTKWVKQASTWFLNLADNFSKLGKWTKIALAPLYPFILAFKGIIAVLREFGVMETKLEKDVRISNQKIIEEYRKRGAEIKKLMDTSKEAFNNEIYQMDRELALLKAKGEDTAKLEEKNLKRKFEIAKKEFELSREATKNILNQYRAEKKLGNISKERLTELTKLMEEQKKNDSNYYKSLLKNRDDLEIYYATKDKEQRDRVKEHYKNKIDDFKAYQDELKQEELDFREKAYQDGLGKIKAENDFKKAMLEAGKAKIPNFEEDPDWLVAEKKREAEINVEKLKDKKIAKNRKIANDKKVQELQDGLAIASQSLSVLSDINDKFLERDLKKAGNNEKLKDKIRKAHFEREKRMNEAEAVINGAQAILRTLASTPPPFSYVLAGGMAIATGLQINAIKNTKYKGGGSAPSLGSVASGSSSAGNGVNVKPVSNSSTQVGDNKVYVTEGDITSTQNNVQVIEAIATF